MVSLDGCLLEVSRELQRDEQQDVQWDREVYWKSTRKKWLVYVLPSQNVSLHSWMVETILSILLGKLMVTLMLDGNVQPEISWELQQDIQLDDTLTGTLVGSLNGNLTKDLTKQHQCQIALYCCSCHRKLAICAVEKAWLHSTIPLRLLPRLQ